MKISSFMHAFYLVEMHDGGNQIWFKRGGGGCRSQLQILTQFLRVNLAEKGTHLFRIFFSKYRQIFHNSRVFFMASTWEIYPKQGYNNGDITL